MSQTTVNSRQEISPGARMGRTGYTDFPMKASRFLVLLLTPIFLGTSSAEDRISIVPRVRPENTVLTPASMRIDVRLLQIAVIVTDVRGRPLTDLRQNAFRVFEDEIERPITTFSITETPISATVVFDTSRSMRGRVGEARAAVEQFLKLSMPGDEFSLVGFSNAPALLTPMTQEWDGISKELSSIEPRGWTALYDESSSRRITSASVGTGVRCWSSSLTAQTITAGIPNRS